MRSAAALALMLTACLGDADSDQIGPQHGPWQAEDWFCTTGSATCAPPAYFAPLPDEVEIGGGGVLRWMGGVEQTGAVEPACIRVPAATESGVPRSETTFCNLIEDGVLNETRAFVMIGWNAGTADQCTCSAHFSYAAAE